MIVVFASAATAPRMSAGSRTYTSVPAGASPVASPTVKLACPSVTTYSSSWRDGSSSCAGMIAAPTSRPLQALITKLRTPRAWRIGDQPSSHSRSLTRTAV